MNKYSPPIRRATLLAAVLALLLPLVSALDAQAPPPTAGSKRTLKILQQFEKQLRDIDRDLMAGNSKKAYREADALLDRMVNGFVSGPAVGRLLGLATVLKAIAAYQLERRGEAMWHWHVATQMFPDLLDLPLGAYGEAGRFLEERALREPGHGRSGEAKDLEELEGRVTKPVKKNAPQPEIPAAKKGAGRVSVVVRVIIDREGDVQHPRILDSQGELTLVYATLDALRRWKFKPATLDGHTVDVYYDLTVNFYA